MVDGYEDPMIRMARQDRERRDVERRKAVDFARSKLPKNPVRVERHRHPGIDPASNTV